MAVMRFVIVFLLIALCVVDGSSQDLKIKSLGRDGGFAILDIHFEGDKKAWAVGTRLDNQQSDSKSVQSGVVLYSEDGAKSWEVLHAASRTEFHDIAVQGSTLVAVGYSDTKNNYTRLMISRDFGSNWNEITPEELKAAPGKFKIALPDSVLYILGPTLMKSSDYGSSWKQVKVSSEEVSHGRYFAMYFKSDKEGWLLGNDGSFNYQAAVAHTEDGGKNWIINTNKIKLFSGGAIQMVSSKTGYALMGDVALKTIDRGENWTVLTIPKHSHPSAVHFANEQRGFILGLTGALLFTDNGGKSWKRYYPKRSGSADALTYLSWRTAIATGWGGECYFLKLPK